MKILSIDTETTGLNEDVQLVEFACVPGCTDTRKWREDLAFHTYIKCDSYEVLEATLAEWVKEHNKSLIQKAHKDGVSREEFKSKLEEYFNSPELVEYFGDDEIVILGKSMISLDYPLMERYLGWNFMRKYFTRRTVDVSDIARFLCDHGQLPKDTSSSKKLMKHFEMGDDVDHTAFSDCIDMMKIYFKLKFDIWEL